jgi:predicted permease
MPSIVWTWLEHLLQDCRYALRVLRKTPWVTLAAVLSLTLGIGASTTVFSVVDSIALRTLPVSDPGTLVNFREHLPPNRVVDVFPYEGLQRFRRLSRVFSAVVGVTVVDRTNVVTEGPRPEVDPAPIRVGLVSGNYFATLGVAAARGRALGPEDDVVVDAEPVAVISDAYWRHHFLRDPSVLGRKLSLHRTTYTVVGVMPPGFSGDWIGRPVDFWVPMMMQSEVMVDRPRLVTDPSMQGYFLRVVARLAPGVSLSQAQAVASAEQQALLRDMYTGSNPRSLAERRLVLESAARGYMPERESLSQALAVLALIVGLVFVIACANVAGLVAARTAARRRDIALRLAIGAGRGRLALQLFAESVMLGVMGTLSGAALASRAAASLVAGVSTGQLRANVEGSSWLTLEPRIDARALVFASGLCVVAIVLVGLWPVLRVSSASLTSALAGHGAASQSTRERSRFARLLVVGQVALSLIVLVDTGLLMRSLQALRSTELGFDRREVLLVWTQPGLSGRQGTALADYWGAIVRRAAAIPGVRAAGAANGGLLDGYEWTGQPGAPMRVAGRAPMPSGIPGWRQFVTPGFFSAAGIPFVAGRDFTERDSGAGVRSVIINQTMAKYYFGTEDPVGRIVGFPGEEYKPTQVIGVVSDALSGTPRERDHLGLTYFSYRHPEATPARIGTMLLALRTDASASGLAMTVQRSLHDLLPDLSVLRVETVDQRLDEVLARDRLLAQAGGLFGFAGLLLASLGLYSLVAYTTARRTTEIGVRVALGATVSQVLIMILKEGVRLIAVGVGLGIPLTLATRQLLAVRLVGVTAGDPWTIASASALLIGVATFAALIPARRAAAIDPLIALRQE